MLYLTWRDQQARTILWVFLLEVWICCLHLPTTFRSSKNRVTECSLGQAVLQTPGARAPWRNG